MCLHDGSGTSELIYTIIGTHTSAENAATPPEPDPDPDPVPAAGEPDAP